MRQVKYASAAVSGVLIVIVVIFSVNNLQPLELDLWPLGDRVEAPVFLVVLLALLAGFFAGAAIAWLSGFAGRRRAGQQRRELKKLHGDADRRRGSPAPPPATDIIPAPHKRLDDPDRSFRT